VRRLDLNALNVPSLHTLTQAGGKLDAANVEHFHRIMQARGGRFFVMYGQTEATARMCILPPKALPEKSASAGLPIPRGSVKIVDGELIYEGPNVMMGYAACRADLAKGDELHGRLRTGDAAHVDEDGYVHIAGRAGREAKLFGLRLNLDEVEAMLKPYGPTAVTADADRLLIFCEHGDEAAYAGYQRELAARLRLHYRAFSFRSIEKLPLTSSGKIDYRRLPA
jgi:acyl-coenzyme A synthetase/AMP-(fatty) acid ligase